MKQFELGYEFYAKQYYLIINDCLRIVIMLRNICKPIGSAIQLQDTILKVRNIAEQQLRVKSICKTKDDV